MVETYDFNPPIEVCPWDFDNQTITVKQIIIDGHDVTTVEADGEKCKWAGASNKSRIRALIADRISNEATDFYADQGIY